MTTLTTADIEKLAELSKLTFPPEKIAAFTHSLENVLKLVAKMDALDTQDIAPLAHPLNVTQPMRPDVVTEENQRALFQAHAPSVEAGLYIVPKFVESE